MNSTWEVYEMMALRIMIVAYEFASVIVGDTGNSVDNWQCRHEHLHLHFRRRLHAYHYQAYALDDDGEVAALRAD